MRNSLNPANKWEQICWTAPPDVSNISNVGIPKENHKFLSPNAFRFSTNIDRGFRLVYVIEEALREVFPLAFAALFLKWIHEFFQTVNLC